MNNLIPLYKVSCLIDASGKVQAAGIGVFELAWQKNSRRSRSQRKEVSE